MEYAQLLEYYIKHTREKELLTQKLIELLKPQKSQTLLDLGCGNGAVTIPLSKHFKHVVAVDHDTTIQSRIQGKPIMFLKQNIEEIDLDEKFDYVLMSYVFYGINNWVPAIERALNHLVPGGKLVIVYGGHTTFDVEKFQDKVSETPLRGGVTLKEKLDSEGIRYQEHFYNTCIRTRDLEQAYRICAIYFSAVYDKYSTIEAEVKDYLNSIAVNGEYRIDNTDPILIIEK